MAKTWQSVIAEIEQETQALFHECPDEIKRFHYGVITHSDAGKHAMNQYFGHWVHLYAFYMGYADLVLPIIRGFAEDPNFDLAHAKRVFLGFVPTGPMLQYAGQETLAKHAEPVREIMDQLTAREDFLALFEAWMTFVNRLYWWLHWYFPWGIGPALFPRLTEHDVDEINRLYGRQPAQGDSK
jgi:hypothetical protein